jgi:hypothetical protein
MVIWAFLGRIVPFNQMNLEPFGYEPLKTDPKGRGLVSKAVGSTPITVEECWIFSKCFFDSVAESV